MVVRNRDAQDLPVGLVTQQHHQRLMRRAAQVDGSVRLRKPELHAARGEYGQDVRELVAVEGAFVLTDHHRIKRMRPGSWRRPSNAAASGRSVQGRRREQPTSKNCTTMTTTAGDGLPGRVHLPGPRRRGVLVLAGGHTTVEREPESTHTGRWPMPGNPLARRRDMQPSDQRANVLDACRTAHVDHLAVDAHSVQRRSGLRCDELIPLAQSMVVSRDGN